jgi:hypothetical protein
MPAIEREIDSMRQRQRDDQLDADMEHIERQVDRVAVGDEPEAIAAGAVHASVVEATASSGSDTGSATSGLLGQNVLDDVMTRNARQQFQARKQKGKSRRKGGGGGDEQAIVAGRAVKQQRQKQRLNMY